MLSNKKQESIENKNTNIVSTNSDLVVADDIYLEDLAAEDSHMSLDFNSIQEETKKAKKTKVQQTKTLEKHNPKYQFSDKELRQLELYVKDVEKHILKFAADGKERFLYDCSKLSTPIFFELAKLFKTANPHFYVETHGGSRLLVVDWCGKNEV